MAGERAEVVRRADNLRPEGDFQRREEGRVWEAGEKVESCKKMDNLKVEGGFDSA